MNFNGPNKSEAAPAVTAENVEKKEVGMENVEAQIEVEAQKLEQGVAELNAELDSMGGESGLQHKLEGIEVGKLRVLINKIQDATLEQRANLHFAINRILMGTPLFAGIGYVFGETIIKGGAEAINVANAVATTNGIERGDVNPISSTTVAIAAGAAFLAYRGVKELITIVKDAKLVKSLKNEKTELVKNVEGGENIEHGYDLVTDKEYHEADSGEASKLFFSRLDGALKETNDVVRMGRLLGESTRYGGDLYKGDINPEQRKIIGRIAETITGMDKQSLESLDKDLEEKGFHKESTTRQMVIEKINQ